MLAVMPLVTVLFPLCVAQGAWIWYVVLLNWVAAIGTAWIGVLDFRAHCAWYPLERGWRGSLKPLLSQAWSDFFDGTEKDGVHLR